MVNDQAKKYMSDLGPEPRLSCQKVERKIKSIGEQKSQKVKGWRSELGSVAH
jgi:hypothetical protein